MGVMKNVGTEANPKFVRDEDKSTSANPYGSRAAFARAKAAEKAEAEQKTSQAKTRKSASEKGE